MLDPRTLRLTVVVAALHLLLLLVLQSGLARRIVQADSTEAVIADLFEPAPMPRAQTPMPRAQTPPPRAPALESARRPDPPKPAHNAQPAPAPNPSLLETPRPTPGGEAVRQAVDAGHITASDAAGTPALPSAFAQAAPTAAAVQAQRSAPGEAAPVGATSTAAPRAVTLGEIQCSTPEPRYPLISRRLGEQGAARVRLVIDASGATERVELMSSSGFERLDRVALESARATRCKPHVADGQAIRVTAVRPFAFRLD